MLATLLCLALAVQPATEPSGDAAAHAERGLRAYEAQQWDEAAGAFDAAYALDPDPQYVYARANALRMAGRCADAIPSYREFLATGPEGKTEKAAQQNLAECEAKAKTERPEVEPLPRPVVPVRVPPGPVASGADDRARKVPIARDPWAHALTWPGLAIAGVGAGLLAEAHARRGRAERADDELAYRSELSGAPTLSRAGIGLLTTGAALVVAGIVRWSILAARRDSPRARRRSGRAALVWRRPVLAVGASFRVR
jgi:tetratricopeptide (TPR) repeat protein